MPTPLISQQLQQYLDGLVPKRPAELQKMEEYATKTDFPIIGPACGHLCYQIARTIGARRVFELGSGFGYSTAWFARAVVENGGGEVHHVVWDKELSRQARGHLDAMNYQEVVHYHIGEAIGVLDSMAGPFDLIFNDIDKEGYPRSLAAIKRKLKSGGVLITDNLLWSGRIFDPQDVSQTTENIREFTRQVFADPGWTASLIPIRDGLLVAYRG